MKKKLLSCMLTSILLITSMPAFALETKYVILDDNIVTNAESILEIDDTRIDFYTDKNGDKVFLQYVNNNLTQINTIPANAEDIVKREFVDKTTLSLIRTDEIRPSNYIVAETENIEETIRPMAANSYVAKGTVKYRTPRSSGGYHTYGLKCFYKVDPQNSNKSTTYTINKYKGTLVDLVSMLVSAIDISTKVIKTYTKKLIVASGISVVSGKLKSALTTTVSALRTKYKWKLLDINDSSHISYNPYGYKYYISDSNYHTGETYYEECAPQLWGKNQLGVWFHNEMFTYSTFEVYKWE